MKRISKAAFKRMFTPGTVWDLTHCLIGPVPAEKQRRTVKAVRSFGAEVTKPDGSVSRLALTKDDTAWVGDGVLEIRASGELAARYVLVANAI
ncbi:MAG: hypothetical protein O7H41_15945 [Planctomycetota bacterium]|nr:hypothetical protein [Planctomycetota bacterium]